MSSDLKRDGTVVPVLKFAGFMASLHKAMLEEFTSTLEGKLHMEKRRLQGNAVMPETFELFWCSQSFKVLESHLAGLSDNAWRLYPKWLKKGKLTVKDILPLKKQTAAPE